MSKNPTTQNNPSQANNITENDEKYKKFFYNTENLENIYNILKGEDKQLKKETVKRLIQDFEGVECEDMKEENKNTSNHISTKFGISDKDSLENNNSSSNDLKGKDNNNVNGTTEIDKN